MTPTSEADLAEAIASATNPISICGGGTRLSASLSGDPLHTSDLSGVSLYEPGALTLVARAGTPVSEIEALLETENQRLAFEPADLRAALGTSGESTLGGLAASNASGPRRIAAGACRDFMLGVRFVDGSGAIIKNGGRVMKNVTGYDLVKLMGGSWGTLGVMTEVSLKVLPKVEMQLTLLLDGLSHFQAVSAMSDALGSPFEVTGAAQLADGRVALRLEGFEASVRYRMGELKARLASYGDITVEEDQARCAEIWTEVRDARAFAGTQGDLWRISVKPSDAPTVLDAVSPSKAQLDWGGGLIWAEVPAGTDLRAKFTVAGHASLMRASADTVARLGRFQPENPAVARLTRGLRQKFDPKGIFNAGLMGAQA